MCLGAVGTQTGGSLIRPASYCGVAACKPTFGRIDLEGVVPVAHHLDHAGLIARSVADLELLLRAVIDLEGEPLAEMTSPPRLGRVDDFFLTQADEAIGSVTRSALARLEACGAGIEAVGLPRGFDELAAMHGRIMAVEAAAVHRRSFQLHRQGYGPRLTALLDEGLALPAIDYAEAWAHQREFRRRIDPWLGRFDAMVMPATDTTAPATLDTTGDPKFQRPWSYAGLPAVSIPCGLAGAGLPAGLQLVGRRNGEAALLAVARWCERCLEFRHLPPL
jgi:aspartyl-tRNA(Asn)/glutamyl-tRNA(Gln) amidotransferase subunit A